MSKGRRIVDDLRTLDLRVGGALLTAAISLTFLEFHANRTTFGQPGRGITPTFDSLATWSFWCFAAYFVVPAIVILVVFRQSLRDYGLDFRGFIRHLPLYFGLLLLAVPVVAYAAYQPELARFYPFDPSARESLGNLVRWELVYGVQFLALEFFFRGFLLFALEPRLGLNSVFVMAVPYCMIHYRKSWPESIAAVLGGIVLGYVTLKTRSVLGGVLIHWGIAITMDVCAIWARGGFG